MHLVCLVQPELSTRSFMPKNRSSDVKEHFFSVRFIFIVLLTFGVNGNENENECIFKETCRECIAEGSDCAWCSEEDYTARGIPRCNLIANHKNKCKKIVWPSNSMKKIQDVNLSNRSTTEKDAIQIKPQEITLHMKPKSPQTFSIHFRQAVDYPVDLYYVMDLSNSMKDDKQNLAMLGNKLAKDMRSITSNFRLGFGSFVDKVAAPYVNSHPDRLRRPCAGCAAPYGFRNHMSLSSRTHEFANKVNSSKISANLDGVEGGFDAIMQAIVCQHEIGWRNKSRKLLVLSTDNGFHCAGDGKLAGIISPNDEQCHLDTRGYYTKTTELDYPSYSQINRQINQNKVNIIFAVTEDQVALYKKLSSRLVGSTTGKLKSDSSNVVQLIQNQYSKITSSVEMTTNLKQTNIRVSFQSSCLGKIKKQTSFCQGLKVGTTVSFDVTVEVVFCPQDRREWNQTFQIYPVGLNEYLTVNLEMICECDCEKPWNGERNSPKCSSGNGTYSCGVCSCYGSKYGKECECDISGDGDSFVKEDDCILGNDTRVCSDLGVCRCGKCHCFKRPKPEEKVSGKFCECDNFSCDKKDGKFCNDHGVCLCKKCSCHAGWSGHDCGCKLSQENCIGPDGKICSDHGSCECGACVCNSSEKEYFGKLCDDCVSCTGKCSELRPCVECEIAKFHKIQSMGENCSLCDVPIKLLDKFETLGRAREKTCTFPDKDGCNFYFKYIIDGRSQLSVHVLKDKECPPPINILAIVSGVAGGVVGVGLLLLLLWKLLTEIHDRREFARYMKELENSKWDAGENPLYKPSTSTFENPSFGKN